MPHLQFDINKKVSPKTRKIFNEKIITIFSKIMETGTEHIAVSLREHSLYALRLGRVNFEEHVCLMNIDIRTGRSEKKKRELAKCYMEIVYKFLDIKEDNQYLTFTNHEGKDFNLYEKSLPEWQKGDRPIKKNSR